MIAILKEMQSPKKFNSPMRRRNLFLNRTGGIGGTEGSQGLGGMYYLRPSERIFEGVPIDITCVNNEGSGSLNEPMGSSEAMILNGKFPILNQEEMNSSYNNLNNEEN
jgi:hypothetical protein